MTNEPAETRNPEHSTRHRSYPWRLWAICLVVVAYVYWLRFSATGRVWHVPVDILSGGGSLGVGGAVLHYLAGLFSIGVGVHALWAALRYRDRAAGYIAAAVVLLTLGVTSFMGMVSVTSRQAAHEIALAGEPLIAALEQYKAKEGQYPKTLDELIPGYLRSIPDTGYGRIRQFHYYRAGTPPPAPEGKPDTAWDFWVADSPYALVVEQVPAGTLVYRPTHRYPDSGAWTMVPGTQWGHTSGD